MNLTTGAAYSYGWWLFHTVVNGVSIFNRTTYSQTTCKHQAKAFKVLNYKADLTLNYTRKSLTDLAAALDDEIEGSKRVIKSLIATIRKPRTRASTNLERRAQVANLLKHISNVRKVKQQTTKAV